MNGNASVPAGQSGSASTSGTLTCTFTWNDDGSGQPAPDHVWYWQKATATGDGLSDAATGSSNSQSSSDASAFTGIDGRPTTGELPYAHIELVSVTGGVATISDTLSASSSVSMPSGGAPGNVSANASYMPMLHPQPYLFAQNAQGGDNPGWAAQQNGDLLFNYSWKSTGGTDKKMYGFDWVYEIVNYPGPPGDWWPGAPIDSNYLYPNPTSGEGSPGNPSPNGYDGSTGSAGDDQHMPIIDQPYVDLSYAATQGYYLDDYATGEYGDGKRVLLLGNLTIARFITNQVPFTGWWYSCTKQTNGVVNHQLGS